AEASARRTDGEGATVEPALSVGHAANPRGGRSGIAPRGSPGAGKREAVMGWFRTAAAILVGGSALIFWGLGVYDMHATFNGAPAYLAEVPEEQLAWTQSFPTWRNYVWGGGLAAGLLGGLLVLARGRLGAHFLTLAFAMMAGGHIGHDLVMADGVAIYGEPGIIAATSLLAIAAALAIAGHWVTADGGA
ncbi:MAG: hypothetical protein MI723_17190, partial [Caulobacterales bacterium]|nr:hypothetical protein [Caulobacterales bacterium]